ncbi:hypothetical protein PR003_g6047 [Phytophthora rubi]|uniref:Uncharacterized protein n=1 Tax=Phytophthora rubi TaxID=129364 RepID=A0A6A4FR11_9STRA|nr:hypothetical protein PR003_g6047 [Phytophthora rubi]
MNRAGATDTSEELDTAGATSIMEANDTAEVKDPVKVKAAVKANDATAENGMAGVNGWTVVSSTAEATVDERRACGERKLAKFFLPKCMCCIFANIIQELFQIM